MLKKRLSSADPEYQSGGLSAFPHRKDTPLSLYIARNNAETELVHTCTASTKYLVVRDSSKFPDLGILKLSLPDDSGEPELIHYFRKIGNQFHLLQRGFAGFRTSNWPAGTKVACPVVAEHHNILKDAIIRIQQKVGLRTSPGADTLHGILTALEEKWLSPKASFRAWPKQGPGPLKVRFQNVSGGYGIKFFWDFGDGDTSTEENPTHTYEKEGRYTVKLNVVSAKNTQGIAEKANYIEVSSAHSPPFFYAAPLFGYSVETAKAQGVEPTSFELVDQTDADIMERDWFFGNGDRKAEPNPNVHTIRYTYQKPGEYQPSLMIRAVNGVILNTPLTTKIVVV